MIEHFIFVSYIFLFILSTIGYGELFCRTIDKQLLNYNIGYQGIIGFFFISLVSLLTSYFFSHNYVHNFIIHSFGIIGFCIFLFRDKKNIKELKYFFLLLIIFLIGAYVFKNHDDFPYYHLTYSLNLSENKFIIGTGVFSHGFRTFSSLFYYHSILYMPFIEYYLFHIGPFFILVYFNYVLLDKILKRIKNSKIDFLYYFALLSFIFVNIVFYRISEHGTDRSAQILLLLIFFLFFDLLFFETNEFNVATKINLILILIFLASSMKAIYYMYLILVPIIFIKKKFLSKFILKKNFFIIMILSLSIFGNLITNYFNTGCFLYPSVKTCVGNNSWSIPKEEVKHMKTHYEWWSKAGGGPGYKSDIKPAEYIKNFKWVENWIERHFFNKVSDTLLGLVFICLIIFFVFSMFLKKKVKGKIKFSQLLIAFSIPLVFLFEWFINHPSMRYGGYVLVALPFLIFTSYKLEKIEINSKNLKVITSIFIFLTISIFVARNISRLNKEIDFYKYDILSSPYFYVQEVKSQKIYNDEKFVIYTPPNNTWCWASKTPCSYYNKLKVKKKFNFYIVYRDDR